MKDRIIEIVELGQPQSLIQRGGSPVTELIKTDLLIEELNEQLRKYTVMCEFHCERFDFGRDKKCEQQCSDCHWMQTKLHQPDVVEQSEQFYCLGDSFGESGKCDKQCNDCRAIEQLICPCCGSDKTYKTYAIHCNRCAVTTEI